jgi:hypothetical protein
MSYPSPHSLMQRIVLEHTLLGYAATEKLTAISWKEFLARF